MSFITISCEALQQERLFVISSIIEFLVAVVFSKRRVSVLTCKISAVLTGTGRLNLVLPVSMWLIWVTEMPVFL